MACLSDRWCRGRQCHMRVWLHVFLVKEMARPTETVQWNYPVLFIRDEQCPAGGRHFHEMLPGLMLIMQTCWLNVWTKPWRVMRRRTIHIVTGGVGSFSRSISALCRLVAKVCNIRMLHFGVAVAVFASEKQNQKAEISCQQVCHWQTLSFLLGSTEKKAYLLHLGAWARWATVAVHAHTYWRHIVVRNWGR